MSHEEFLEKTQELIGIAEQFNKLDNKSTRNALKLCLENFIHPLAWVVQPHLQMEWQLTDMEGEPLIDDVFANVDRNEASLKDLYDSCEDLLASLRDALKRAASPTSITRSASDDTLNEDIQSTIQHHLEAVIEKASTLLEPEVKEEEEVEEVEEVEEELPAQQNTALLLQGLFNPPAYPIDGSDDESDDESDGESDGEFFPMDDPSL